MSCRRPGIVEVYVKHEVEGYPAREITLDNMFPQIEAWITNKPASTAASSEPEYEISFIVDSGDNSSVHNLIISIKKSVYGDFEVHECFGVTDNMVDTAMPAAIKALVRPCS